MYKFRQFLFAAAQEIILWAIWLIGFTLSVVPVIFLFALLAKDPIKHSWWESLVIALLLTVCTAVGAAIYFLYLWLSRRWRV